ncbi:MAG: hypothetical protein ACHRHE_08080 [Tepidisphaerales bacterium]
MTFRGHIRNGVAVLDDPVHLPEGTAVQVEAEPVVSDFWSNKTIEELAREQGVKPIRSLDDLAGDWPAEDSIDEFLAFIRAARR